MKEEASEVGGYFIVNGNEKIIRLLQVSCSGGSSFAGAAGGLSCI
jgi:DNA-directed RNA polymerase beta subunit